MSAAEEITKLGILAGGGDMPWLLVEACRAQGIEPFVVAFQGQGDFEWLSDDISHAFIKIGKAGQVIKALKAHAIKNVVLLGAIQKPSLVELAPDMTAIKFLARHGYQSLGDDGLLSALRSFLEVYDLRVCGAHHFMPDMVTPKGVLGRYLGDGYDADIQTGVQAALELGAADRGQSVVVHKGEVVAREDRTGTDAMIVSHGCEGAVLVKMCKPQQDRDLDLPTIGLRTVQNAIDKGFAGIAVHGGESFFLDRAEAIKVADENGLFIIGVKP